MKTEMEASHYDKIVWSPEPCAPGTMFYKPEKIARCSIGNREEIIIQCPCRIDVGLIDYSALKFTDGDNNYKAGEMSFAGDAYTKTKVVLTKDKDHIESERPLIVRHILGIMRNVTNYKGGFMVETIAHPYRHIGFGSSAMILESVATAVNILLGEPLTFRELRKLVAYNFVEEADSAKELVFPGASTGGSFNTAKYGGFVITSSECEAIFRTEIPKEIRFVVGTPKIHVAGPEESDTDVNCMSWERHNERINAAKSALWIITEIMPFAVQGDWKKVGEAFYNYTLFGGKAMQMLYYQASLADILFQMKINHIEGGWMTSAGPSLVAFTRTTDETVKKAEDIFKERNFDIVVVKPDNYGIREIPFLL
jgi:beta-ribofuranosylaminobenzene 5'-phosphate synthase